MLRKLVGGLAVAFLASSLLYAKQGTVVTKDGHSYEGDVTEKDDAVEISGVAGLPGPVGVKKANIASVSYADKVSDDVRAALVKLDPKDVKSRIELAKVAMQSHAYEAARDVLQSAAAIEPNNRDVADLMLQVGPHLPPPATNPTPATKPVATAVPIKAPVGPPPVKRQVNPNEINAIRQIEWRGEDDATVKIQIKPEVKKKFIDSYPDITPAEFNRMNANQQAALILTKGDPKLFPGVQLTTDPASIAEFKKTVNQVVVHSCGTGCHGGSKPGTFTLSPTPNNAGVYTNFLVLQQYAGDHGPLVDRVNPEASPLLQYMLPPEMTTTPHRPEAGYKPVVRSKNDPRYQQVLHWIQSLNPIAPNYKIDLTKDAPVVGAKTEPGKETK